jgi:uncharacterized protein DUF3987/VirE-like protein
VNLGVLLDAIRTGRWREPIEEIRSVFHSNNCNRKTIDRYKQRLPAILFSGTFKRRTNDALTKHSGFICADLDSLGPKLPHVLGDLKFSPHLFAVFRSPSGDGLKAIFRVPADAARHDDSFRAVERHVFDLTGLQIDGSGKDLARLCFVSADPNIEINENATEIEPLPPESKEIFSADTVVKLAQRQQIAVELLGPINWQCETHGFLGCPGKHLHTTSDGEQDCEIHLDGAPNVHCFHDHCAGMLAGINHQLQSEIGKAERACVAGDQTSQGEPVQLTSYLPPPLTLLPQVLQEYVNAAAEALNVDESLILLPGLSSLGAAIGNSRSILLKRGFVQPSNIWSGILARSGARKSPALEAGCLGVMEHERSLTQHNKTAREYYEEELANWQTEKPKYRGLKPELPPTLTCVMDDLTMEVLADVLIANPRGVLIRKDELAHFLGSFDQYKSHAKGSDVSRWLSLHTGVFIAVDRRSDNRHHRIWQPRVCITGGIQPKVLRRALTEDFFERGLPARFLFAYPPFRQDKWSEATIPDDLRAAVLRIFSEIWLLQHEKDDRGNPRPVLLKLDPDAKAIFVEFYDECGAAALGADERGEAAYCKLTAYGARLALVGQLARKPEAKVVTGDTMRAACDLARWCGNEAMRIYAELAETRDEREQRELIEFIQRRGGAVSEREVMQSFNRLKNDKAETRRELTALVKAGIGKWELVNHGGGRGRPTRKFQLLSFSTSTQFSISQGKTEKSVDVDPGNSQKTTPAKEPRIEPVSGKEPVSKLPDVSSEVDAFVLQEAATEKLRL